MASKLKKRGPIEIDAYDIGGKIKYAPFLANHSGQFWPVGGANFKMEKAETPHHLPASEFFEAFSETIANSRMMRVSVDLRAVDICGPVVNRTCLRLVNRGILDAFSVASDVVINDAMAAFVGSLVAGVAKGHQGGAAYSTLGTGVGGAGRVWVSGDDWQEHLMFEDWEMHFRIVSPGFALGVCNCGIDGCAEALVKEEALNAILVSQDLALHELIRPGKEKFDAGRDIEYQLSLSGESPFQMRIFEALKIWHQRLAVVTANVFGNHVLGGDKVRPPALFIFGGGLARFVDPNMLREMILELSGGQPQNGTKFEVRCEQTLGNRAGVIGAAAAALMKHLKCGIEELEYLPNGPKRKMKKT